MPSDNKHLSVAEVADRLGASERTVRNWIDRGYFPGSWKMGPARNSHWRVPEEAVLQFQQQVQAPVGVEQSA